MSIVNFFYIFFLTKFRSVLILCLFLEFVSEMCDSRGNRSLRICCYVGGR